MPDRVHSHSAAVLAMADAQRAAAAAAFGELAPARELTIAGSRPGTSYRVVIHPSGAVRCTCAASLFHPGRLCRHGRAALASLDSPSAERPAEAARK